MSFQDYVQEFEKSESKGKPKVQFIIGIAIVVLAIIVFILWNLFSSSSGEFQVGEKDNSKQANEQTNANKQEEASIYVHISGCVNKPGLYELSAKARVAEAIEKAGGASDEANLDALNLAEKLQDGQHIVVESKTASVNANVSNDQNLNSESQGTESSKSGKVNINTADESLLQSVSGIGPSKASKIVAYREKNGKFKSVDDLVNVSGIGEKTLASIKDQLCI